MRTGRIRGTPCETRKTASHVVTVAVVVAEVWAPCARKRSGSRESFDNNHDANVSECRPFGGPWISAESEEVLLCSRTRSVYSCKPHEHTHTHTPKYTHDILWGELVCGLFDVSEYLAVDVFFPLISCHIMLYCAWGSFFLA